MINKIRFNIIAGKINKIPVFYMIFARKMPDYIIRQRNRGRDQGQNFGLEDKKLTSLLRIIHHTRTSTDAAKYIPEHLIANSLLVML